jgi:hypothetical protein
LVLDDVFEYFKAEDIEWQRPDLLIGENESAGHRSAKLPPPTPIG